MTVTIIERIDSPGITIKAIYAIDATNNEKIISANLQSCGCRLAIFVNEQNNKI